MKTLTKLVFVLCLLVVYGCGKEDNPDYWMKTQEIILDLADEENSYKNDDWNMQFLSSITVNDEEVNNDERRNLMVEKILENTDTEKKVAAFYFEYIGDLQGNMYTYEKTEIINKETSIVHSLSLTSTNGDLYSYSLSYTITEYEDNRVLRTQTSEGRLIIENDGIVYFSVPYLKEGLTSIATLLSDFETEFDITLEDERDEEFFNIAKACENEKFDAPIKVIDYASEESINYYSDIDYTATGHTYFWNLNYEKGYTNVAFRKCEIESLMYMENYNVTLEEVEPDKFYDMKMSNGDLIQRVAFYEDKIFIYSAEDTYEQIENDLVNNKGMESEVILGNKEIVL